MEAEAALDMTDVDAESGEHSSCLRVLKLLQTATTANCC